MSDFPKSAVIAELNRGPLVYCASARAIIAATAAYQAATGEYADPSGLAAAFVAAHAATLGLDRSVCLRDLLAAGEAL